MDNKIDKPAPQWEQFRVDIDLIETLWSGNAAIKRKGKTYLFKAPKENDKVYEQRLQRATLTNYYKKSVQRIQGAIFDTDIQLNDAPEQYKDWADNIDLEGNNLTQFGKILEQNAINHGLSFYFVDHPTVREPINQLQKDQMNIRPYFVSVPATQILDTVADYINNVKTLVYLKFEESCDGYTLWQKDKKKNLKQVREYWLNFDEETGLYDEVVSYKVTRKVKSDKAVVNSAGSSQETWIVVDEGIMDRFTSIPLVPVYTEKKGFMCAAPPLQDLADIQLLHYNAQSDYQWILHMTQVPMLLLKGYKPPQDQEGNKQEFVISSNATIDVDENGDASWIKTDSGAVAAGRTNIKDIEEQTVALGYKPLMSRTGNITATSSAIDEATANSDVKSWARSLEMALEQGFRIMQMLVDDTGEPIDVMVNQEFTTPFRDANDVDNLITLWRAGVLTAAQFADELKRRDVIRQSLDSDEIETRMLENKTDQGEVPPDPNTQPTL